jgi:hypothetical protein
MEERYSRGGNPLVKIFGFTTTSFQIDKNGIVIVEKNFSIS